MDVELLAKMTGELILDHDEVALPGFGVFVAEMVPASFSDKGFTINPPYRKLSFRQRESDGRELVEFYARVNNVDEREAERMILDFLSELKETLKTKKSVVFPGLGKLRATKENHFFFVPDEDLNIYPEGFGLVPVSLKSHEETPEDISATIQDLKQMVAPQPEPVLDTIPSEPTPEPIQASEPIPVSAEPHPSASRPSRRLRGLAIAFGSIAAAAAIFLSAVAILGRVAPDFMDSLLYSPEELEILYR